MSCNHGPFKASHCHVSRLTDYPYLKIKAVNATVVTRFLQRRFEQAPDDTTDVSTVLQLLLWAMDETWTLSKIKDTFMTAAQAEHLLTCSSIELSSYHWLSTHFASVGLPYFKLRPKFHHLYEIYTKAINTRVSLWLGMTLNDETFGGRVAKLTAGTHPRSMCKRGLERWLISMISVIHGE